MVLCKFFQQGSCKFGAFCRFEHPTAGGNQRESRERFNTSAAGGGSGGKAWEDALSKYKISLEVIEKELSVELPQWILSAYGPGRDTPEQLFGGYPREQSFEEVRLYYVMACASGNEQQAVYETQQLYQNAQQQIQFALKNSRDAVRFILDAENKHPNRIDICRAGTQGALSGGFVPGNMSQAGNVLGGSGDVLGKRDNPFETPALRHPSHPNWGGQPQQTAFGQPSQTQQSAFGARQNPFGAPALGQPSQLGAGPMGGQMGGQRSNPFASNNPAPPASNAAVDPFSVTAIMNQSGSSQPLNSFSQQHTMQTSNTLGQMGGQSSRSNPFAPSSFASAASASNPFGAANNLQQNQSGFQTSRPNPFATSNNSDPNQANGQTSRPNPFATATNPAPNQANNPFAQNASSANNGALGSNNTSNPSGQPGSLQRMNTFATNGQNQAPNSNTNTNTNINTNTNTNTKPNTKNGPYHPDSVKEHPALESYATKNQDGTLATFKGQPVVYKDNLPGFRAADGIWTRIWFPAGAPGYNKDTELPPADYEEQTKNQWAAFAQAGDFADGVMPEMPPPRDCTRWDF
ncbi:hypothetical protein E4U57_005557 [Claviceps arundinis]|uniref:C3H1-type domain-containing protein n=1 Tax=Claviceps arundinis TaxID=1623583 RepID=A0ABQ7PHP5_9HYPO|nr:hypothetical protein E4U57_005557 [Claviceps arundinis]